MAKQYGELPPPEHQTLALSDTHFIGSDGLPRRHHTIQRIRALGSLTRPMTRLPYYFDADTARVVALRGGKAAEPRRVSEDLHAVDITFPELLRPGQEAEVEYATAFDYPTMPPTLFRRRVGRHGLAHLGITVVFDDNKLPAQVWQAEWDGAEPDSLVTAETQVGLLPCVGDHRRMGVQLDQEDLQPGAVLGFRWEWAAEVGST